MIIINIRRVVESLKVIDREGLYRLSLSQLSEARGWQFGKETRPDL